MRGTQQYVDPMRLRCVNKSSLHKRAPNPLNRSNTPVPFPLPSVRRVCLVPSSETSEFRFTKWWSVVTTNALASEPDEPEPEPQQTDSSRILSE
jgi:hypothetical protein